MIPTYAVKADLEASPWSLTITQADADKLIGRASRLVRKATISAYYVPDSAGLPTDPALKKAFSDAVCSQVETWTRLSADPALGAADGGKTIAAKSRGSASIQYVAYASTVDARARATTRLSEDATIILWDAGLVGVEPVGY